MTRLHIISDTRQQAGKHTTKEEWWREHGVSVTTSKVVVGDYILPPAVAVDTKRNISELAQDIEREHERFRRECMKAQELEVRLIILTENTDGIDSLESLRRWQNPRAIINFRNGMKPPIDGTRLSRACATMQERYGVQFLFCAPDDAARRVVELLGGVVDD